MHQASENYASIGTCYTGFSISRSELASVLSGKKVIWDRIIENSLNILIYVRNFVVQDKMSLKMGNILFNSP